MGEIFTNKEIEYILSHIEEISKMPMDNTPHPSVIHINGVPHVLRVDINEKGERTIKPVPESEIRFK